MKTLPSTLDPQLEADAVLAEDPQFPEGETGKRRNLQFLGFAPCPVRSEMRRRLLRRYRAFAVQTGTEPRWYIPSGCHEPTVYDDLWKTENADELPELIAEAGFGGFNRPEFVKRWLDTGLYEPIDDSEVRPEFRDGGLVDPLRIHRVYGLLPEILVVDLARLGDRPMPRRWEDVLHPRFQRDVIIGGEAGEIRESLLFGLGHQFGEAGLEALGRNLRGFMHPSLMARSAGSANPNGAAVYIAPLFFIQATPNRSKVIFIWPEEGAYCMPFYLMRKRGAGPAARLAEDFLTGQEWAAHLAGVSLAPARIGSPPLPGRLQWPGWDFVRRHDVEAMRAPLNAALVRGLGT